MKRWIIPGALVGVLLVGSGMLFGVKRHSMDPLRNAPELKVLLSSATEVDEHYSTASHNDKVIGMYPYASFHLPTTPKETVRALKANLLGSDGWKVEVYYSPWFSLGATKIDASGKVICKVSANEEGKRIDPKDPVMGWDRTCVSVEDPSNNLPSWRAWVYDHLHF